MEEQKQKMSNGMNKIIIAIVVVAVIGFAGYFLLRGGGTYAPSSNLTPQPASQKTSNQTPLSATAPAPITQETPSAGQSVITYTNAGYSPNTLRVKVGAAVTFKNESSRSMWTASVVHPTHRGYPTTGGCIGSTFDACQGIQPGKSWSFTFDIAGTWGYHNHLNPGDTGTVVVE